MIRTSAEAVVKFTAVSPVASVMVKSSVPSTTWSAVMLMFSHLNGEAPEKVTDVVRDVKSKESNMEKFRMWHGCVHKLVVLKYSIHAFSFNN